LRIFEKLGRLLSDERTGELYLIVETFTHERFTVRRLNKETDGIKQIKGFSISHGQQVLAMHLSQELEDPRRWKGMRS